MPINSGRSAEPATAARLVALLALAVATLAISPALVGGQSLSQPSSRASARGQLTLTPVAESVPTLPRWYRGDDGQTHLKYELLLTNAAPLPVDISSLDVLAGDGRRIAGLSGSSLEAALSPLGDQANQTTRLPPSSVGVVWLDLALPNPRAVPRRIEHRLTVQGVMPEPSVFTYTGASTPVARRPATVVAPPLRGGSWGAVVDNHRRSMLPINAGLPLGQRFAVDFSALLDAEGRTSTGDPLITSSWHNYGKPVLAAGIGKVVEAVDRYPDQIPTETIPLPVDQADGNHVIIKLRKGVFAAYAHLKPGSLRVRRGDHVRTGQVLGKVGNTGNTSGPHLHFQLMNRPSFLDADGLPFVFDAFELDGRVASFDAFLEADDTQAPVPIDRSVIGERRRRGLTGLEVMTFPGG